MENIMTAAGDFQNQNFPPTSAANAKFDETNLIKISFRITAAIFLFLFIKNILLLTTKAFSTGFSLGLGIFIFIDLIIAINLFRLNKTYQFIVYGRAGLGLLISCLGYPTILLPNLPMPAVILYIIMDFVSWSAIIFLISIRTRLWKIILASIICVLVITLSAIKIQTQLDLISLFIRVDIPAAKLNVSELDLGQDFQMKFDNNKTSTDPNNKPMETNSRGFTNGSINVITVITRFSSLAFGDSEKRQTFIKNNIQAVCKSAEVVITDTTEQKIGDRGTQMTFICGELNGSAILFFTKNIQAELVEYSKSNPSSITVLEWAKAMDEKIP